MTNETEKQIVSQTIEMSQLSKVIKTNYRIEKETEELYMNGETTKFFLIKDGPLVTVRISDCPDEEELEEIFQE